MADLDVITPHAYIEREEQTYHFHQLAMRKIAMTCYKKSFYSYSSSFINKRQYMNSYQQDNSGDENKDSD